MSIVDDLAELFADTISCQPGTVDSRGKWTAAGAATDLPCYFEGGPKLVRNASGQEVVSQLRAIIAGAPDGLSPGTWRFTIPSRYSPNTNLQALSADAYNDETGTVAYEVAFP